MSEKNKPKEYKSPLIEKLLDEVTPEELERADNQMSKKQTAVEWYKKEVVELAVLLQHQKIDLYEFLREIGKLELQAKEMEKQQIMDAFDIRKIDIAFDKGTTSDQYYQETYGE